ncbi:MAG: FkbM family methyltransferase [Rhodospirillales bacterium]|jgi:FkbM family methyltransferase|nr:FkbM family methyltransferase [Rhodospirillales bacterium]
MTNEYSISELPLRARFTYLAHAFKAVYKQHHLGMLPMFERLIPENGIVLDVGGHAGQFAKLFAKVASNGHVYSFEPGRYARSILRRSLARNSRSNTTIVPEGLGDSIGEIDLVVPVKKNGVVKYGVSHMGEVGEYADVKIESVHINTIDDFVRQQELPKLDFIKADIEGWEQRMVLGGEQSIRKYMPVIMIEMVDHQLSRAGDSLNGFWELLVAWGYAPFLSTGDAIKPLEKLEVITSGDVIWIAE